MWTVGAQTWSGAISHPVAGCTQSTDFGTTNPPTTAYYRSEGVVDCSGYLYNWKCVNEQQSKMCPSPWRVPTQADFVALDVALGGTGNNRSVTLQWIMGTYVEVWGACFGGAGYGTNIIAFQTGFMYWPNSVGNATDASYVRYAIGDGNMYPIAGIEKRYGCQIRCVR
jgi:uncharacterized protein (TIGR02145 family)